MAGENTIFSLIPRKKRMKLAPSYLRKGDDDNYYDASVSNGDNSQANDFALGKQQRYDVGTGLPYTSTAPVENVTPSMAQYDPNAGSADEGFDYSLAQGVTPTANTSYGGAGQLPTMTSVSTVRRQSEKANAENSSAIANYNAVKGNNGLDYTTQYLNKDGKGMTKEVAMASPAVNSENEVVNNFATEGEQTATPKESNVQFLQSQGLDTSAQMQKDYEEYMKNAPEYVSEEEQARRLRSSQSAKTVADLGSLASAFANLWGTNKGAYNQQVAYAKAPDYNSYIQQWQGQRSAYRTYAQKGKDYVYQKQMQKAQNDYNKELQKLNLEYKQAQIDLQKANSNSKLVGDAIKKQQLELAQQKALNGYNYKVQTLNQRQAYNNAQIGLGYQRLAEDTRHHVKIEQKSSDSGKGSNKNWHIEGENGLSVDVPIANMNDYNRNQLLKLCGSDGMKGTGELIPDGKGGIKEETKPMSKEEKWAYIAEHMNLDAENYIRRLGGQVSRQAPVKSDVTPAPTVPSYASPTFWGGSNGVSQGGGMWYAPSSQQVSTTNGNSKSFGNNYNKKNATKKTPSSGSNSKHKY